MITDIKVSYFNPAQSFTLVSRCLSAITPNFIDSLGLEAPIQTCNERLSRLDMALSKSSKSTYTDKIKEQDDKCDKSVVCLKAITKAYRNSHIPEVAEAATLLFNVIHQSIPNVQALGYVSEMANIKALHTELQGPIYQAAIKLLMLEAYVKHMITERDAFEALYIAKNIDEASKNNSIDTVTASKDTLEGLISLLRFINANLLLNSTPELLELEENLNSIITSVSRASK